MDSAATPRWRYQRVIVSIVAIIVLMAGWVGARLATSAGIQVACGLVSIVASVVLALGLGWRIARWRVFIGLCGLSWFLGLLNASLANTLAMQSVRGIAGLIGLISLDAQAAACAVAFSATLMRGRGWRVLAFSLPVLIWLVLIYTVIVTPEVAAKALLSGEDAPAWFIVALYQLNCLTLLGLMLVFIDPVREVWRTFIAK